MSGEITVSEVRKAIRKLNCRSAPGADGLTSNYYRAFIKELSPILCLVYNDAIVKGHLPPSQCLSIIKLLPKKKTSEHLKDFRPINLLNTDVKILSHILTERVKYALNKLINPFQFAYLPQRNIHTAVHLIKKRAQMLNRSRCLVSIDFSKAFDKIDRNYLYELLSALNFDNTTIRAIKVMYTSNIALIEINGHLSTPLSINRGVKQGCPLSALLFILGVEPLLKEIEECEQVKSFSERKTIAYADDITCCIKVKSLETLFDVLKDFCDQTSLEINIEKSVVLSLRKLDGYNSVNATKILGIPFNLNNPKTDLLALMRELISKNRCTIARCRTMRAKALAIDTFVLPKFLYVARHENATLTVLKKCQSEVNSLLKIGQKMEIKAEIFYLDVANGGIGLPYVPAKLAAAHVLDFARNDNNYNPDGIKLLKHFQCVINDSMQLVSDQVGFPSLSLHPIPLFKKVYNLLMFKFKDSNCVRLLKSAARFDINYDIFKPFLRKLWKSDKLLPFQKDLLFRLCYGCLIDKQVRWLHYYAESPLCSFCQEEFETSEHLLFSCNRLTDLRTQYDISSWDDVFVTTSTSKLRFVTSVLLAGWLDNPVNTKTFLSNYIQNAEN